MGAVYNSSGYTAGMKRFLIILLIGAATLDAQTVSLEARVSERLAVLREESGYHGLTSGIVLADGARIAVASGWADADARVPLKATDRMLAGSTGKTFAAAVVLQAVDEGVLDLDTKIGKWIGTWPGFARLPNAKDLTLRLLMSHRTGINDYVLEKEFTAVLTENTTKNWTAQELAGFLIGKKPLSEAGTAFAYADANFVVAGLVYETATKRKLFSEVERRVLKPLKLEHTVTSESRNITNLIPGKLNPRMPFGLDGYTLRDGKLILNAQSEYAGGGIISTSGDLARWAKLLWEGKAFSAAQLQQMLDAQPTGAGRGGGRDAKYGLAVQVQPSEFGTIYAHGGWFPGYQTEMVYFPDQKAAIALQANQDPGLGAKKSLRACLMDLARLVLKN